MSLELLDRPRSQDFHAPAGVTEAASAMDVIKQNTQPGYGFLEQTARIDSAAPVHQLVSEKAFGHNASITVEKHKATGDIHLVEAEDMQQKNAYRRTSTAHLDNAGNDERDFVSIRRGSKERQYTGDKARRLAPFVIKAAATQVVGSVGKPQSFR